MKTLKDLKNACNHILSEALKGILRGVIFHRIKLQGKEKTDP